jgi:NADH:ubiquinone reductase (non-electrogenic)
MKKENIYLVGFGWATIGFLHNIDTSLYNVTVISDSDHFLYTPLLAQNVVLDRDLTIHINSLKHKCSYINDKITDVEFKEKLIKSKDKEYNYNYVVFAHGSNVNTFNIHGVQEFSYFLKTNSDYKKIRSKLNSLQEPSNIVVIGCGLTGSELIGSLNDLKKHNIVAIDALNRPLITFRESLSLYTYDLWKKQNVNIMLNSVVSKINKSSIELKDNTVVPFDLAIWCGGVKISALSKIINEKLHLTDNKGILVDKYLKIKNAENAFAIGDCASAGYPPTAQVAYQQGRFLASNFNNNFKSKPFVFDNKGQVGYIGNNQSVFQNNYFSGSGRIIGVVNTAIHLYNFGKIYILSKL